MSIKKLTAILVSVAAVFSFASCGVFDHGAETTTDSQSVTLSPSEDTSTPSPIETSSPADSSDTAEIVTSADATSAATPVGSTATPVSTTAVPTVSADTTPEIPADTSAPPETTAPEETTAAETTQDVSETTVPDPEAGKEAYYETYYSSNDFGYAGEIKKVHMESNDQTFDFISSGSFFRFSGKESSSFVSIAEKDGHFILTVSSVGENGSVSTQYYRSEKKEGESFSDFTSDLGFDDLGAVNRDELIASGYNGAERIDGVLYDSVEITASQKIVDDDGKETGESFSVPFLVYVQPDTHKIFRFYMIEEYMTIGADGKIEISRELLSIDYLSEYTEDIPVDAVFEEVSTAELTEFYQATLLAILLGT